MTEGFPKEDFARLVFNPVSCRLLSILRNCTKCPLHIVEIRRRSFQVLSDVVNDSLEGSRHIRHTKDHHPILVKSEWCDEGRDELGTFGQSYSVVSFQQVNGGNEL